MICKNATRDRATSCFCCFVDLLHMSRYLPGDNYVKLVKLLLLTTFSNAIFSALKHSFWMIHRLRQTKSGLIADFNLSETQKQEITFIS